MFAEDFIYDNHRLSEFGCIIVDFQGSDGFSTQQIGMDLTFNLVSAHSGKINYLTSSNYSTTATMTFGIAKNPDVYGHDKYMSDKEVRALTRWLQRRNFHEFTILNEEIGWEECSWNASFNIELVFHKSHVAGLQVTMFADRPFGLGKEIIKTTSLSAGSSYVIEDLSDEVGYTYPKVTIKLKQAGKLEFKNDYDSGITVINNCKSGETINFSGETMIITTSDLDHELARDFNFVFPKIGNTYERRTNSFTSNLSCDLTVSYRPVIKNMS